MSNIVAGKLASKLGPKMGRLMLKGKAKAPDIAVVGGLAVVIGGTIWLVKRSYEASSKIDMYREIVEDAKEQGNKEDVSTARKDFAKTMVKTYGPPMAVIGAGCAGVFYGRHLFRTRNLALMTANGVLQKKLTNVIDKVDEEKGEGVGEQWANGIDEIKIDEVDEKGKKKSRKAKMVKKEPSGFAMFLDESSEKFHPSNTLNRTMIKHAEDSLNRDLVSKGVVTTMDAYSEVGFTERMLKDLKGKEFVNMCKVTGWVNSPGTVISFNVFDVERLDNARFLKGEEPVCLIEPNVAGYLYDLVGPTE